MLVGGLKPMGEVTYGREEWGVKGNEVYNTEYRWTSRWGWWCWCLDWLIDWLHWKWLIVCELVCLSRTSKVTTQCLSHTWEAFLGTAVNVTMLQACITSGQSRQYRLALKYEYISTEVIICITYLHTLWFAFMVESWWTTINKEILW